MPPDAMPIIAWMTWKPVCCGSLHGSRKAKTRSRRYGSNQIAAPPTRAVTALADREHRGEQHEADEHDRPRERPKPSVVEASAERHQRDAEDGVDHLPLQVVARIRALDRGRARARAVDHDEAEGDQPQRHENQKPRLE